MTPDTRLLHDTRIYADESGTHGGNWLVIGMLFVPDHGTLHSELCKVKEKHRYFETGKHKARYKEVHFAKFKSLRDETVAKLWIDSFLASSSFFRSIVVDWNIWEGRYFGDPFEPDALKKRRAYKKWAELLLQPELSSLRNATFYLDRLRLLYGYDVVHSLKERFQLDFRGELLARPKIVDFQPTDSWRDANQCLQLCDLLVGCTYQTLAPGTNKAKTQVTDYLYNSLQAHGVKGRKISYWRGFGQHVRRHFAKFSEWVWQPTE